MNENKQSCASSPDKHKCETTTAKPERDEVQEAAEESFPASDPPSWSPVTAGPPDRNDTCDDS